MELFDRSKKLAVPPEIWVALTVERPEMIKVYLDRIRAHPDQADVAGLAELIGAMAEEILDLRDRLRHISKIRRDLHAHMTGVDTLTRRVEREADFAAERPHVYEADADDRKEVARDQEREAERPYGRGRREALEAAFLAHVRGESPAPAKAPQQASERLKKGTWVKVIELKATGYQPAVQKRREEFVGRIGQVTAFHNSHGLYYDVRFKKEGYGSSFDHDELEVLERGYCPRCCDANPGPVGEPCPTCEEPLGPYHGI